MCVFLCLFFMCCLLCVCVCGCWFVCFVHVCVGDLSMCFFFLGGGGCRYVFFCLGCFVLLLLHWFRVGVLPMCACLCLLFLFLFAVRVFLWLLFCVFSAIACVGVL